MADGSSQREGRTVMFLVYMYFLDSCYKRCQVVTVTREEAEEYVAIQMQGYNYNGQGVYQIEELPIYKGGTK